MSCIKAPMDFFGNNYTHADTIEREESLRSKVPELLDSSETVKYAYKSRGGKGRDSVSFTNYRLIFKDKQGVSGKKTLYLSIPYESIQAWSIETPGGFEIDSDAKLKIHARGFGTYSMDLANDSNFFEINLFLSEMVLIGGANTKTGKVATAVKLDDYAPQVEGDTKTSLFDLLGDNAKQIDTEAVEKRLRMKDTPLLLPDEKVELAFKCGRDSFLLTTMRILHIDVKGMSGKCIEYYSVTYPCIKAFSIETAGGFLDRDAELRLYTNVGGITGMSGSGQPQRAQTRIDIDFRKGKADLMAVQRFFSDKLMGADDAPPSSSEAATMNHDMGGKTGFFSWLGDDSKMIDPVAMDQEYHSAPYPILQNCEKVEMAFKGRRDLVLFTNKRFIMVDMKGFRKVKKAEFFSLPWTSVSAFMVQSAGSFMDNDSEMILYPSFDDVYYPPQEDGEDPPPTPPPEARWSEIEIDFQKDRVDLMAIKRYLSERILRYGGDGNQDDGAVEHTQRYNDIGAFSNAFRPSTVPIPSTTLDLTPPGAMEKMLGSLTGNAKEIDPAEVEASLRGDVNMLQTDEHVALAYKAGRDTLIFTTKRIISIDTKGFSGKKVAYISIPFHSVRGFEIQSVGSWDLDAEVKIKTSAYWKFRSISQDLSKGKADVIALQSFLALQVHGSEDGTSALDVGRPLANMESAGAMSTFLAFVKNDGRQVNTNEVNTRLHNDPPILQKDESVDAAYRVGRDTCVITTKRILMIDVQGIRGRKVSYKSYPLKFCTCFSVQTAGKMFSSPEATWYLHGISGNIDMNFAKSKIASDIWDVQEIMKKKILLKSETHINQN